MQGPRLLLSASCLRSGRLPLTSDPSPPNCTWASQPGSSPGPMLQNMGRGTLCSADGEGASSAAFCLCTDLSPIPSPAELGPTWVSPKASFPGSGTTGSPFFPALGRPASSHCGTAHCCSQAAAPVQGASTDLSGAWGTSQACPLAPGGRGTGSSPLAETVSQGHSLHPQAVNVNGHQASVHTALTDHMVFPPERGPATCYLPLPDLHPSGQRSTLSSLPQG